MILMCGLGNIKLVVSCMHVCIILCFNFAGYGIMLLGGWPVGYDADHFSATEDKHSIPSSMGTLSFCLQGNITKYTCHKKVPKIGFCICVFIHIFAVKIWDIYVCHVLLPAYSYFFIHSSMSDSCQNSCI